MTRFRSLKTFALVTGVGLASMACGGGGGTSGGGTDNGGSKGTIVIASDLPVSGADASDGIPAQNGANFAVTQKGTIKGFKLVFKPFDDAVNGTHDPQKGAQNVQQMVSDNTILGMVGPFNSGVAQAEIPVANQAHLAMISPANTNECLTQTFPYCNPQPSALRPAGGNNYFRVAAADTFQGPAMADYAYDTLKITKVAVWSDNETFGKGVADNFSNEFKKKGGSITNRQDFDTKTTSDFKSFLTAAKSAGAQGIYAGATSGTKGCVPRGQMKDVFTTDIFYMGPDGISNSQCVSDSGSMANDKMYSSVAAADANQNPAAKPTIDAYTKAYPSKNDLGSYTFASYDCAAILVDAIGRAIDTAGGKMPTRQQVVDAVAQTKAFPGTTGTYTFDKNGDPTQPTMAIFNLKGTSWAFVKQFAVGG